VLVAPGNQLPLQYLKTKNILSNLVPITVWNEQMRISVATSWRWRKHGLIKTVNIHGRIYISREEIARFEQRAGDGEFKRESNLSNP
jgi:hypothetical protein